MMKNALMAVGCLTLFVIGFYYGVYLFSALQDWMADRRRKKFQYIVKLARIELGLDIKRQACWFSDNPDHVKLLQLVGQNIQDQGFFSADKVRDVFRGRK